MIIIEINQKINIEFESINIIDVLTMFDSLEIIILNKKYDSICAHISGILDKYMIGKINAFIVDKFKFTLKTYINNYIDDQIKQNNLVY